MDSGEHREDLPGGRALRDDSAEASAVEREKPPASAPPSQEKELAKPAPGQHGSGELQAYTPSPSEPPPAVSTLPPLGMSTASFPASTPATIPPLGAPTQQVPVVAIPRPVAIPQPPIPAPEPVAAPVEPAPPEPTAVPVEPPLPEPVAAAPVEPAPHEPVAAPVEPPPAEPIPVAAPVEPAPPEPTAVPVEPPSPEPVAAAPVEPAPPEPAAAPAPLALSSLAERMAAVVAAAPTIVDSPDDDGWDEPAPAASPLDSSPLVEGGAATATPVQSFEVQPAAALPTDSETASPAVPEQPRSEPTAPEGTPLQVPTAPTFPAATAPIAEAVDAAPPDVPAATVPDVTAPEPTIPQATAFLDDSNHVNPPPVPATSVEPRSDSKRPQAAVTSLSPTSRPNVDVPDFSRQLRGSRPWAWMAAVAAALGLGWVGGTTIHPSAGSSAKQSPAPVANSVSPSRTVAPVDPEAERFAAARPPEKTQNLEPTERTRDEAILLGRYWTKERETTFARFTENLRQKPDQLEQKDVTQKLFEFLDDPGFSHRALEVVAEIGSSRALDILYDVWTSSKDRTPTTRLAEALLLAKDIRSKASPALNLALSLRDKPTDCSVVSRSIQDAQKFGDRRAAMSLLGTVSRKTCGPKQDQDCARCVADAKLMRRAIRTAAARPSPVR